MSRCAPQGPLAPQDPTAPLPSAERDTDALGQFLAARRADPLALYLLDALRSVSRLASIGPRVTGPASTVAGWPEAFAAWQRIVATARAEEERDHRGAARSHDADPVLAVRLRAGSIGDLSRRARRAWERVLERDLLTLAVSADPEAPRATENPDR